MFSRQRPVVPQAGGYRRYAGGQICRVAWLLFAGDLVPLSLWRQRLLLHSGTRKTFGALSRLAGHVFVPAFLPEDYPPFARGGSGQVARNGRPDALPLDHLPLNEAG